MAEKTTREFKLRKYRYATRSERCEKAGVILERAHSSSEALLHAFEKAWIERGRPRGVTPDDEQDLLRAMLVMAAAGLDSTVKQLIRDALPDLVEKNPLVRKDLEKFVARNIRGESEGPEPSPIGAKFLGRILAAKSSQAQVIEEYIRDLTGTSLQSAEELAKAASALGLSKVKIVDVERFKEIFGIRNKIIHELDINLDGDRRKRNERTRATMMRDANALLEAGEKVLAEVDEQLAPAAEPQAARARVRLVTSAPSPKRTAERTARPKKEGPVTGKQTE